MCGETLAHCFCQLPAPLTRISFAALDILRWRHPEALLRRIHELTTNTATPAAEQT